MDVTTFLTVLKFTICFFNFLDEICGNISEEVIESVIVVP